jgi:hypothetical protein
VLPQAARYILPSGAGLELSVPGGQVVLAAEDPAAILLLSFPNAAAADSLPEDVQMTRLFRGIDSGDWEPLRNALWADVPFEIVKQRTAGWWAQQKKELGDFVSVRPVHMLGREIEGDPELQALPRACSSCGPSATPPAGSSSTSRRSPKGWS